MIPRLSLSKRSISKWEWQGNATIIQRHWEEETQNINSHITARRQLTKSNRPLSLSQRDDCKSRKDTKYCKTEKGTNTKPTQTMGATINEQQKNHHLRTDNNHSHQIATRELKCVLLFYLRQIFALDFVVVKAWKNVQLARRLTNFCK